MLLLLVHIRLLPQPANSFDSDFFRKRPQRFDSVMFAAFRVVRSPANGEGRFDSRVSLAGILTLRCLSFRVCRRSVAIRQFRVIPLSMYASAYLFQSDFFRKRFNSVAYLQQIWWFEVDGQFEFPFPAGTYGLFFRLQLGRAAKRFGRRICNTEHVHGWDINLYSFSYGLQMVSMPLPVFFG
ncbi:hypothetical protein NC651_000001 [Populus alba x Populus x berolinensis]|nr:hypothetical protein NC651_000001 [Populus alba x Populus x berolinensis]